MKKKTILIMSSGRSGSTWLAGLLASPFRYRLLFEPFHPGHIPDAALVADHYFEPEAIPGEVVNFVQSALEDRIDSTWIAQHSNRRLGMHRWRFWPKVRIVKIIRGNLMIPAIRSMYGDRLPIVLLMRHPGAVVDSFMRVKFPWAFDISTLLAQKDFAKIYGIPLDYFRGIATDPVGIIMARWFIENLYLFQNAEKMSCNIVFYEDLVQDPAEKIRTLCASLGVEAYHALDEKAEKPSVTTHPKSHIRKGDRDIHSWRTTLPRESVRYIDSILSDLEFEYPGA